MSRPAWAKKAFRIATLHRECKAAGGHVRTGERETRRLGGVEVLMERCGHCTALAPAREEVWQ